jgi:hypothetical protein
VKAHETANAGLHHSGVTFVGLRNNSSGAGCSVLVGGRVNVGSELC